MLVSLLRRFLRPYAGVVVAVVLLQLVQTAAALALPTLNAAIIDNGVVVGDLTYIVRVGGVMLAVSAVQVTCAVGAVYLGARTAMSAGRDIRAAVFDRVQRFSAAEMGRFGAPTLITRNTNDVQQIQMVTLMSLTVIVMAPITMVGGVVMALQQDVVLSALLLVAVPALGAVLAFAVRRMGPLFKQMQQRIDRINLVLREQITGVRVVRSFNRQPTERDRFDRANVELRDTALGVGKVMALVFPLVQLIIGVSSVGVIWFGAGRIDAGEMQVGALVAFLNYLMQILMAVLMAVMIFMMVPRAEVSAERVSEVLAVEPEIVAPARPVRLPPRRPGGGLPVELDGATFGYPGADEPVLRDVTIRLEPGRTTAVIGSTGSGKTALVNLVPRLVDVTAGVVRVAGHDVRDLDPGELRERVALVPQKAYLFSGTVASTLRHGKRDATDAQLWEALEVAQARDFVEALPDGLEAPIEQAGGNLSGGQRQRLAIARALLRRADVYLFDDSFSALDFTTDARLRAALPQAVGAASVLVVGQRVASIKDADQIVVLEDGAVVGLGTHTELMESSETYREIVLSQLSVEEAA
ncbi:ABC transporter ATP-binding protein [Georgenia halophila]|uniref:ABC transporter ATP-binding protein n=1 Tax=Georgenia halophila TaxID=620889 RepID=A0ABP8L4W3_9MICO